MARRRSDADVELVGFRLANYETPLWAVENFAAGRFNAAGVGTTQYLSLHPQAPWAELLRSEDRRTADRARQMRYPLWAVRVRLARAPVVLDFATAPDHGLSSEDLVADDCGPCRALAARWRDAGAPLAFTAPSAALPGARNLVLLTPRVVVGWDVVPVDELDLPAALAARDGRCPDGLWDLVHHRGAPAGSHPALAAWRAGEALVVVEPPVVV